MFDCYDMLLLVEVVFKWVVILCELLVFLEVYFGVVIGKICRYKMILVVKINN